MKILNISLLIISFIKIIKIFKIKNDMEQSCQTWMSEALEIPEDGCDSIWSHVRVASHTGYLLLPQLFLCNPLL